jgi:hypothetical protein
MTIFKRLPSASFAALLLGATAIGGGPAAADQVFADDVIIQGSLCVGFDCVNNENFGSDTIILKENNLRIFFNDTSNTGSFPNNKWRLIANDSVNGGANYFAIEDSTAGRQIFRVDAGARANSIYVSSTGKVGFGTSTPVLPLHELQGDTPALRLQQDGSSGFTPQTWDIAGNEANFFVRDVTNGSLLPFRIRPGAPTSSLDIAATGNVGIGVASASAPLTVQRNSASFTTMALLQNLGAGGIGFRLQNSVANIDFNNTAGEFRINFNDGDPQELALDTNGNLRIAGTITTSGSCSGGCDRVFDAGYKIPTIAEHAKVMWEDKHLPAVGSTPENGPFNLTQKVTGLLNELEKAHIYIAQLNRRLEVLESKVKSARKKQ